MLEGLLQCKLQLIPNLSYWELKPKFDTRNVGDVAVEWSPQCLMVANSEFCDDLLFHGNRRSYDRFLELTGMRGRVVFFCMYDSGGNYGFSMFEDGRAIRHRLHSIGFPRTLSIMHGKPLTVEQSWLPAVLTDEESQEYGPEEYEALFRHRENRRLVGEQGLNKVLVDTVLENEFGFSLENGPINGQKFQGQNYRAIPETQAKLEQPLPWWRRIIR